jgi:hypothetical protein
MGETRRVYEILFGKPSGKSSLGRPRPVWKVNIKVNLKATE